MKFALLFLFISIPALAAPKHINLLVNMKLENEGDGYHAARVFFPEKRGEDNVLANGCILFARSKGNFVLRNRYKISWEEAREPSTGDNRWYRQFVSRANGFELWVSCKSHQRVNEAYVDRVMGRFVRVE